MLGARAPDRRPGGQPDHRRPGDRVLGPGGPPADAGHHLIVGQPTSECRSPKGGTEKAWRTPPPVTPRNWPDAGHDARTRTGAFHLNLQLPQWALTRSPTSSAPVPFARLGDNIDDIAPHRHRDVTPGAGTPCDWPPVGSNTREINMTQTNAGLMFAPTGKSIAPGRPGVNDCLIVLPGERAPTVVPDPPTLRSCPPLEQAAALKPRV